VPVLKFRTIEEMNDAQVLTSGPADVERFFRQCARYWALAPRQYPRGVFKFRSVEDMRNAPSAVALPAQRTPN